MTDTTIVEVGVQNHTNKPEHDQQDAGWKPDPLSEYHCWAAWWNPDTAKRDFEQRHGYAADVCELSKGLWWLGPVREKGTNND